MCLAGQYEDTNEIEKQPNALFENICDCSASNKSRIHFGNDKTISLLFAINFSKKLRKLNIKYRDT